MHLNNTENENKTTLNLAWTTTGQEKLPIFLVRRDLLQSCLLILENYFLKSLYLWLMIRVNASTGYVLKLETG